MDILFLYVRRFEVTEQPGKKPQVDLTHKGSFEKARREAVFLHCFYTTFNNSGVKTTIKEHRADNKFPDIS